MNESLTLFRPFYGVESRITAIGSNSRPAQTNMGKITVRGLLWLLFPASL